MNLRPKTKRRLVVLLSGAAFCTAAVMALIAIQLHRHEMIRRGFRDKAMSLYGKGDYVGAMIGFKKYLSQSSGDAPAIYAYAVSRSEVPEPDLKHLVEAKSIFSRYLEINPSDARAQHRLLAIYRKIRYDAEALALANTLLDRNPDDVEALQAKLQAMIDQWQYEPALALSTRVNELAPLDLEAQMTTYRLLAQLKRSPDEMVSRADRMMVEHPQDPRFELLRAVAAGFDGDEKGVEKWLNIAAGRPAPDGQFIEELSGLFERIGMFARSRKLLAEWLDAPHIDPEMLGELAEREWEACEYQAALDRLVEIDPSDRKTDAHLLGLKALILYSRGAKGDREAAEAIRASLYKRSGENVAGAWNALLKARFLLPAVQPKQAVMLCQAALHRDPENAVGRFFLGLSYNDLGETELAMQCWRLSAKLAPSWAGPHLSEAQALLDEGHIDQAYAEAEAARACSENSLEQAVMLAMAKNARLGSAPATADLDSLLGLVQTIQSEQPNEPKTLPIYVELLVRAGRTQDALAVSRAALQSQAMSSPSAGPVLLELARVSAKARLGLEPAIADLLEQIKPATPETMYDRALILAMLGERADGLQSLTAAREAAGADSPQWQLVVIRYRQTTGDGDLSADWSSLGDTYPKNLMVQRAVLEASAASPNRGLTDRTIERIRALTGEESITWRLARARWELAGTANIKTNAGAAAAMMGDVVRMAPDLSEPQLLWATALEKLGDQTSAIERLRTAAALEPGDFDISLRLADRLQLQGKGDEAKDILETLAQNQGNAPERQLQIARVLWQQGQPDAAIRVLNAGARIPRADRDLLLAQVYQGKGEIEQAARLYDELMKSPVPSDTVIQAVAWFDAWRGDVVGGRHVLDRLSEARELTLADFDETFGSPDAAMAHYQAAVTASPADVTTWKALAGFQLRRGKFDDAAATAVTGLKSTPGDRDLLAIKLRAPILGTLPLTPALKLFIAAFSTHPTDETAAQTLDALVQDHADSSAPERLRVVADNNARFLPAQMLLAEAYFSSAQVSEAEAIAARAMQASPTKIEPARVLTAMTSSVGQWTKALAAAQEWRNRAPGRSMDADIQIAEAKLHLNDPQAAVAQLMPYMVQAQASPNQNIEVIKVYAEALVRNGRSSDAKAMLDPLLPQSPRWRMLWLDLGVRTSNDAATARTWIEKVAPQALSGGDEDHLALAEAWCAAGQRFNDSSFLLQGREIAQTLSERANPPAPALLTLGTIAQQMNDLPTAELNFRKVIQLDATNSTAKNDVANVILSRGGDFNEAREFAQEAITAAPTNSSFYYTLASIDARNGNANGAMAGFKKAIALDATSADALIGLAEIQVRGDHHEEAAATLGQAESILDGRLPVSEPLRKRLEDLRMTLRNFPQATSVTDLK
jgi:predicted Zn-dependent protease